MRASLGLTLTSLFLLLMAHKITCPGIQMPRQSISTRRSRTSLVNLLFHRETLPPDRPALDGTLKQVEDWMKCVHSSQDCRPFSLFLSPFVPVHSTAAPIVSNEWLDSSSSSSSSRPSSIQHPAFNRKIGPADLITLFRGVTKITGRMSPSRSGLAQSPDTPPWRLEFEQTVDYIAHAAQIIANAEFRLFMQLVKDEDLTDPTAKQDGNNSEKHLFGLLLEAAKTTIDEDLTYNCHQADQFALKSLCLYDTPSVASELIGNSGLVEAFIMDAVPKSEEKDVKQLSDALIRNTFGNLDLVERVRRLNLLMAFERSVRAGTTPFPDRAQVQSLLVSYLRAPSYPGNMAFSTFMVDNQERYILISASTGSVRVSRDAKTKKFPWEETNECPDSEILDFYSNLRHLNRNKNFDSSSVVRKPLKDTSTSQIVCKAKGPDAREVCADALERAIPLLMLAMSVYLLLGLMSSVQRDGLHLFENVISRFMGGV